MLFVEDNCHLIHQGYVFDPGTLGAIIHRANENGVKSTENGMNNECPRQPRLEIDVYVT